MIPHQFVGEAVAAGEGAGEDDAGVVAQGFGQHPAVGEEFAGGGAFVGHDQGDAGFAQGVQAGGHGELGGDVEGFDEFCRHAILCLQVKIPRTSGQFDHIVRFVNRGETAAAIL